MLVGTTRFNLISPRLRRTLQTCTANARPPKAKVPPNYPTAGAFSFARARAGFLCEPLRALVGEIQPCAGWVHCDQLVCLQLLDSGHVFVWRRALGQEDRVQLVDIDPAIFGQ